MLGKVMVTWSPTATSDCWSALRAMETWRVVEVAESRARELNRRTIEESINPGRIVLTRMLSRACETAAERESPRIAALVAS